LEEEGRALFSLHDKLTLFHHTEENLTKLAVVFMDLGVSECGDKSKRREKERERERER
jgi:hypothetical protein